MTENNGKKYPLNRGDILILMILIEQEIKAGRGHDRLFMVRDKLRDLTADAPQMPADEAGSS